MNKIQHTLAWLAAGAVVVTLAGCTLGSPGGPTANSSGSPAEATTGGTPEQLSVADGPLYPYRRLAFGGGLDTGISEQERQRLEIQQQNKIQELVAACMTEQGFEYTLRLVSEDEPAAPDEEWKLDDRDWVSRYGYGVSNYPGRMPPGQVTEKDRDEAEKPVSEAEDQAFQEALFGDDDAADWRDRGCFGAAQHEIIGYQAWQDPENQPIIEAIHLFYFEDLADAPQFAPLDAEWAACMTEHDFPDLARQPDAQQSINDLLGEYHPEEEDADGRRPWEINPRFGTLDDPPYAAIAEQEVQVALADLECRQQTDYSNRHLVIQFELEERFIADHQEELDAMKSRAEQSGG